jgi:putative ABC transport system substrate-binding protein
MDWREFIFALGGAAAPYPVATQAQQAAMPQIGILGSASAETFRPFISAYRSGLKEAGLVEGRDISRDFTLLRPTKERTCPQSPEDRGKNG